MFDPTVYENVKVVLEGSVYDLDLTGNIQITGREDQIDLSSLSRKYKLRFRLKPDHEPDVSAEINLTASLPDLAAELLELKGRQAGCFLALAFEQTLPEGVAPDESCWEIREILQPIWSSEFELEQTVTYRFGDHPFVYQVHSELRFGRRGEEILDDLPDLLDHAVLSLQKLEERAAGRGEQG